jgi:hypothetical protein
MQVTEHGSARRQRQMEHQSQGGKRARWSALTPRSTPLLSCEVLLTTRGAAVHVEGGSIELPPYKVEFKGSKKGLSGGGSSEFLGYCPWAAAAIKVLLDIDDTSYRDAQFCPRDLVGFARQAKRDYAPPGIPYTAANEPSAKAGETLPHYIRMK